MEHNSLVVCTSNELPNIKWDTGTRRRVRSYEHKVRFTNDENEVDESKGIHKVDTKISENMPILYNAIVDIFMKKCNEWLNGASLCINK